MNTQSKLKKILEFSQTNLTATSIILITVLNLMVITIILFWYTITNTLEGYLSQQTEVLGNSLATQASFNATQSILTNDLLSLNVLLNRLVIDQNILSAHVYNKEDELLAEASSRLSNGIEIKANENQKIFSSVIKFRQENVGHVIITLDRTLAQDALSKLSNLLISVGVFIIAISLILVFLVTRLLFTPINSINGVLTALNKGYKDVKLTGSFYRESERLQRTIQKLNWKEVNEPEPETAEFQNIDVLQKPQIEFNFDQFFEADKKRNCMLFIELENMDKWQENYTPLQIANLFTPVYRAMFQASKAYLGHVHQYDDSSAVILFNANDCDDQLYINAVCTAQLFKGLIDKLMQSGIYADTPEVEYKICIDQGIPEARDKIKTDEFHHAVKKVKTLINPLEAKSLILTEDIFTLPEMQNKVFTSLPDIFIDKDGNEVLSYCIRYLSKSLAEKVNSQIQKITA